MLIFTIVWLIMAYWSFKIRVWLTTEADGNDLTVGSAAMFIMASLFFSPIALLLSVTYCLLEESHRISEIDHWLISLAKKKVKTGRHNRPYKHNN